MTGDPTTATFSADAGAATASVGDGAATATAGNATATAGDGTASASVGGAEAASSESEFAGNVENVSARDVDGDGTDDVIHATVDGIRTITHLDDEGNITLMESDTDGDGYFESASNVTEAGEFRTEVDADGDGIFDGAVVADFETGAVLREELLNADGTIMSSNIDTDGDGVLDTHLIDSDGDGRFETVVLDTDADGFVNDTLVDTDGDGIFDLRTSDSDGDAAPDVFQVGGGTDDLGSIAAFESHIPATDAYFDQHDADSTAGDLL